MLVHFRFLPFPAVLAAEHLLVEVVAFFPVVLQAIAQ
jgi:hypothetical protein